MIEGSTSIEFAIVALPLVMFIIGLMEFGMAIWTQSAMQFAVEQAARCATVNTTLCATPAQVTTYASSVLLAPGASSISFSFIAATCGNQVSATTTFSLLLSAMFPNAFTLSAMSCHPLN
jgi:Flp pilus assembly protein TadG